MNSTTLTQVDGQGKNIAKRVGQRDLHSVPPAGKTGNLLRHSLAPGWPDGEIAAGTGERAQLHITVVTEQTARGVA